MEIKENFSLKSLNTFSLDVLARYFIEIDNIDSLKKILKDERFLNSKKLILGGGSNLLFTKDFDGLVIKNNILGIEKINEDSEYIYLEVGAGENWHNFVLYCLDNNYSGIENLSLIPGTVGASPMQNIGAYGVEIKDIFYSLKALELQTLTVKEFNKEECKFAYRESVFKKELKDKYIIASVTFKLNKRESINTSYGDIKNTLLEMGIDNPNIKDVSNAVCKIRSSKLPDPKLIGNAGSFFKNPEISPEFFNEIKEKYPEIPSYKTHTEKVKIPAGWLIEKAGWKGKTFDTYGVHKNQALVLVNYGNANGNDINKLADDIKNDVFNKFNIILEKEVNII
ncbi:MAG: UDP-N-acetylmuramate dehydrogenase [Candidatus Sericytochromatia bacterium]